MLSASSCEQHYVCGEEGGAFQRMLSKGAGSLVLYLCQVSVERMWHVAPKSFEVAAFSKDFRSRRNLVKH